MTERASGKFIYRSGELHCGSIPISDLASQFGTPLYVYSAEALDANLKAIREAFGGQPTRFFYAVKANSHHRILQRMCEAGFGADVVSLGELERAIRAGFPAERIVFSGVGKSREEIKRAVELGIYGLQIESIEEIPDVAAFASAERSVRVALRINPDIDAKTHPKIATGLYDTKFGIAETYLTAALAEIRKHPALKLVGIGCHLGSQIADTDVYRKAAERIVAKLKSEKLGDSLEYLNLGGGFAYDYQTSTGPDFATYAEAVLPILAGTGLKLALEPGRSLVVDTGLLLTEVIRTKTTPRKNFVIVDASMTELIRPALYDAYHRIVSTEQTAGGKIVYDIVGPVCETSDSLGSARSLPKLVAGDRLAILERMSA